MIAITGKAGTGKSYLIDQLSQRGYKTLKSDDFFTKCYQLNQPCFLAIKEQLGSKYVSSDSVNKAELKSSLMNQTITKEQLDKVVHPFLFQHLVDNEYDFVEIPIITSKACDFVSLFDKIINLNASFKERVTLLKNRQVNLETIKLLDSINEGFDMSKSINISYQERSKPNFIDQLLKLLMM